ncbi:hypothetical protein MKZ38_007946 [Zalerion maritima]|uniref:Uncharacterized protein n=1 Tax=Zalerion maritima TaxID=339359 RepID=A0AAD5RUP4_9PEZI|nr:hypothetical protein MKZ38_007946 [Zalerion maritima]
MASRFLCAWTRGAGSDKSEPVGGARATETGRRVWCQAMEVEPPSGITYLLRSLRPRVWINPSHVPCDKHVSARKTSGLGTDGTIARVYPVLEDLSPDQTTGLVTGCPLDPRGREEAKIQTLIAKRTPKVPQLTAAGGPPIPGFDSGDLVSW